MFPFQPLRARGEGGQGTSGTPIAGPSLRPPLPGSQIHTYLAMYRASEWRQATKRPLMTSIFLAVD